MDVFKISMAAARVNANMTQAEIAKKLGVTRNTVMNWEAGKSIPRADLFENYCEICGLTKACVFLPTKQL